MNATTTIRADVPPSNRRQARYGARPSPRRRAASLALALAIEILLLLALLTLDLTEKKKPEFEGGRITTFDISADSQQEATRSVQEEQQVTPTPRPPRPVPPVPKPTVEIPERPLQMIEVSREVFEAADISKLGSNAPGHVSEQRTAQSGSGGRGAPGDSRRVGTAPNGEPLYAAEWYREPTDAEVNGYLTRAMKERPGWGMIACKTAPDYRVVDCVELGQQPAGSHLASAVRQAAWQFKVRPPRLGGKPIIGGWVQILIDWTGKDERSSRADMR